MEAAEKIPKKLYVYLDTTRGLCHRHGGEDVPGGGAGHRVRHPGQRDLRRDFDAVRTGIKGGEARRASPFLWIQGRPGSAAFVKTQACCQHDGPALRSAADDQGHIEGSAACDGHSSGTYPAAGGSIKGLGRAVKIGEGDLVGVFLADHTGNAAERNTSVVRSDEVYPGDSQRIRQRALCPRFFRWDDIPPAPFPPDAACRQTHRQQDAQRQPDPAGPSEVRDPETGRRCRGVCRRRCPPAQLVQGDVQGVRQQQELVQVRQGVSRFP